MDKLTWFYNQIGSYLWARLRTLEIQCMFHKDYWCNKWINVEPFKNNKHNYYYTYRTPVLSHLLCYILIFLISEQWMVIEPNMYASACTIRNSHNITILQTNNTINYHIIFQITWSVFFQHIGKLHKYTGRMNWIITKCNLESRNN